MKDQDFITEREKERMERRKRLSQQKAAKAKEKIRKAKLAREYAKSGVTEEGANPLN